MFLKGNDSHDYKFSAAVLEDYRRLSPSWRERHLAASVFWLNGSGAPDNDLVHRARQALGAWVVRELGMTVKTYLLSFPERLARSVLGLGAGVAREVGEVALPEGVRRGQLYQNLVDPTLRNSSNRLEVYKVFTATRKRCQPISSPGGPQVTRSKCLASSLFARRPSGSSRLWPTSAGWAGT